MIFSKSILSNNSKEVIKITLEWMTFLTRSQEILSKMNWRDCLKWMNALLDSDAILDLKLLRLIPWIFPIKCTHRNSVFNPTISIWQLHPLVHVNHKKWTFLNFFHSLKNRRNRHHKGNFSNVLKLTKLTIYLIQVHEHKWYSFSMVHCW